MHKQVVFAHIYEYVRLNKRDRAIHAEYSERCTRSYYRAVYIRTELARRTAKNVFVTSATWRNASLPRRVRSAVSLQFACTTPGEVFIRRGAASRILRGARVGPPTLILGKKRSEKGVGLLPSRTLRVSLEKRSDNASMFL